MVATEQRLVDFFIFRLGVFPDDRHQTSGPDLPYVFAETDGFQMRQADHFDVLLGMDVLDECDLTVRRTRHWTLRFG